MNGKLLYVELNLKYTEPQWMLLHILWHDGFQIWKWWKGYLLHRLIFLPIAGKDSSIMTWLLSITRKDWPFISPSFILSTTVHQYDDYSLFDESLFRTNDIISYEPTDNQFDKKKSEKGIFINHQRTACEKIRGDKRFDETR